MALTDHKEVRKQLYDYFDKKFPAQERPQDDVVHYIMCNREGKLARPLMVVQTAQAYGCKVDPFPHATAVELIHRASCALDDTPSMDNARFRQGADSCWVYCAKKYGLSGDTPTEARHKGVALTGMVVNLMTGTYAPDLVESSNATNAQKSYVHKKIREVSTLLVDGQCRDLGIRAEGERRRMSVREHTKMYQLKSGELFATSAQIGGAIGNASLEDLERLGIFGRALGTAFQLIDDYKDLHSTEGKEGKPVGLDAQNQRPNLASRLTDHQFRRKVQRLRIRAIKELRGCAVDLEELIEIAQRITRLP